MDPSFGLGRQYLQGHRFEYDTMKTVMSCGRKMQETPESLVTLGAKLVAISLCLTILHLSPRGMPRMARRYYQARRAAVAGSFTSPAR